MQRMWKSVAMCAAAIVWGSVNASGAVNQLANPGAESGTGIHPGTVTGWTVGGTSNPGNDNGTFDPVVSPHTGSLDFYGGNGTSGTLSQTVDLVGGGITATSIDTGTLSAGVEFFQQSLSQSINDSAGVSLTFLNASHVAIGSGYNAGLFSNSGSWLDVTGSAPLPVGTRFVTYTMNFVLNSGGDIDSYIDDNSLTISSVPTPEPASLGVVGIGAAGMLGRRRKG